MTGIVIPDGGTIGSASDTDALTITNTGVVKASQSIATSTIKDATGVNNSISIATNGEATFAENAYLGSGKGIYFDGQTTSANFLDDYEEGTWNPTTVTSGTATGNYIKIGRVVHVWLLANSVTFSSFVIGGLPFSASVSTGAAGYYDSLAPGSGQVIVPNFIGSNIQMEEYNQSTGGTSALSDKTGTFRISGTYLTS